METSDRKRKQSCTEDDERSSKLARVDGGDDATQVDRYSCFAGLPLELVDRIVTMVVQSEWVHVPLPERRPEFQHLFAQNGFCEWQWQFVDRDREFEDATNMDDECAWASDLPIAVLLVFGDSPHILAYIVQNFLSTNGPPGWSNRDIVRFFVVKDKKLRAYHRETAKYYKKHYRRNMMQSIYRHVEHGPFGTVIRKRFSEVGRDYFLAYQDSNMDIFLFSLLDGFPNRFRDRAELHSLESRMIPLNTLIRTVAVPRKLPKYHTKNEGSRFRLFFLPGIYNREQFEYVDCVGDILLSVDMVYHLLSVFCRLECRSGYLEYAHVSFKQMKQMLSTFIFPLSCEEKKAVRNSCTINPISVIQDDDREISHRHVVFNDAFFDVQKKMKHDGTWPKNRGLCTVEDATFCMAFILSVFLCDEYALRVVDESNMMVRPTSKTLLILEDVFDSGSAMLEAMQRLRAFCYHERLLSHFLACVAYLMKKKGMPLWSQLTFEYDFDYEFGGPWTSDRDWLTCTYGCGFLQKFVLLRAFDKYRLLHPWEVFSVLYDLAHSRVTEENTARLFELMITHPWNIWDDLALMHWLEKDVKIFFESVDKLFPKILRRHGPWVFFHVDRFTPLYEAFKQRTMEAFQGRRMRFPVGYDPMILLRSPFDLSA